MLLFGGDVSFYTCVLVTDDHVTSVPVCFLQKDLIHTIGESAALGAAGFVIWGDLNLTSSRVGVPCPCPPCPQRPSYFM